MSAITAGPGWSLDPDKQGFAKLGLRGPWTDEVERAIQEQPWERISLQAVEWADYKPLLPFRERLRRLSVFGGPPSCEGLDELTALTHLDLLHAVFKGVPALERLRALEWLELNWGKSYSEEILCLPRLIRCLVAGYKRADFNSLKGQSPVVSLEVREGALRSLDGLGRFSRLEYLSVHNARQLEDINGLHQCDTLRQVEIDNCAKVSSIEPTCSLDSLEVLKIGTLKRAAPLPSSSCFRNLPKVREVSVDVETSSFDGADIVDLQQLRSLALRLPSETPVDPGRLKEMFELRGRRTQEIKVNRFKTHSMLFVSLVPAVASV